MLNIGTEFSLMGYRVDLLLINEIGALGTAVPKTIRKFDCGKSRAISAIPEISSYLKKNNPNVMITALPHLNMAAIIARFISGTGIPIIITEHNTLSQSVRFSTTYKGRSLPSFMKLTYPFANEIIAVSEGVKNDLRKLIGLGSKEIHVIANPVITKALISRSYEPPRHPWFESSDIPLILGVGRLTPAKDFDNLIRSFSILRRTQVARLVILGEGPEFHSLKALITKLNLTNDVALCGFVENPYSLMRRCSVFALSSRWEGLPTVLIEALACGTRVVSTDCPSGPTEILQGGALGKLVPISNPEALAIAITDALHQPRPTLTPSFSTKYSPETVISQYQKVLTPFL